MKIKQRPRIALLIETSNDYGRGLLRGINAFIHEHHPWAISLVENSRGKPNPEWLKHWQGDGIIARVESETIADMLAKTRLPVVNVSSACMDSRFPVVETDDEQIAQLAADHLISLGLKNFAYSGTTYTWSRWRGDYFKKSLQLQNHECSFYEESANLSDDTWESERLRLMFWIQSLPRPIGIFAAYDSKARQVIEVCQQTGLLVPEEIAVIGVDNDQLICELCDPPLTSIIPDTHRTGYIAASVLEQMMTRNLQSHETIRIKPLGIARRKSTDIQAIDDPNISKAIHFIHKYAYQKLTISQVLEQIPLSRRVFEKRFKQFIGHTPHEEIMRKRIERVRILLLDTDLSQPEIAERSGFEYVNYMNLAFKKWTGTTPGTFRKQHHSRNQ